MDIKRQGFEATVVAADQTDQWLLDAAQEIHEVAEVVPETKESVFRQSNTAVTVYNTVKDAFNSKKRGAVR